jgi:tryptophan-rich sensory protein
MATIVASCPLSRAAAFLMLTYLAWVAYAAALDFGVRRLTAAS